MKREMYILLQQTIGTVRSLDSILSADDEEQEWIPKEMDQLTTEIAKKCSKFQLENAIVILEKAKEKREESLTYAMTI